MFLSDFNQIFDPAVDEGRVSHEVEISATAPDLSPEDIRSPRRQLFQDLPTPAYNQPSFPRGSGAAPVTSAPSSNATNPSSLLIPGFTPLQPSNEAPRFGQYLFAQGQGGPPITVNGTVNGHGGHGGGGVGGGSNAQEYKSLNGSLAPPGNERDLKAKRRESSLLMMTMMPAPDGVAKSMSRMN